MRYVLYYQCKSCQTVLANEEEVDEHQATTGHSAFLSVDDEQPDEALSRAGADE